MGGPAPFDLGSALDQMDSYGQLWTVMDRHWDVGCVGCSLSRCEVMVEFDPGDLPGPLRRLRLGRFRRFG